MTVLLFVILFVIQCMCEYFICDFVKIGDWVASEEIIMTNYDEVSYLSDVREIAQIRIQQTSMWFTELAIELWSSVAYW